MITRLGILWRVRASAFSAIRSRASRKRSSQFILSPDTSSNGLTRLWRVSSTPTHEVPPTFFHFVTTSPTSMHFSSVPLRLFEAVTVQFFYRRFLQSAPKYVQR